MRAEKGKNPRQEQKGKQKTGKNTAMNGIGTFFVLLFLVMAGYLLHFTCNLRESVVNNEYNRRIDGLETKVLRGEILSADGKVLAKSIVNENGDFERQYPYGNIFSHVVGISSKGKSGIEKRMNYYLLVNHNGIGKKLENALAEKYVVGDSVVTTLNTVLQQTAYDALGENRGAVVAIEPATGKILAMVSRPDFDPNFIDYTWNEIITNSESVLFNRATQGLYPPGSTFKIITLLEFMRQNEDYQGYHYVCDGSIYQGGLILNCINGKAHGNCDLARAFSQSCNSSFADIGLSLDKKRFIEDVESLLFNQELPYDLEYNKSSFTMTETADQAMVMETSIGQGETLISPLHNCMMISAVANKGMLMKPYLVGEIHSEDGSYERQFAPEAYGELMTPEEAEALTGYLEGVVTDGTAYSLKDAPYTSAGKTGSAQYDSSSNHHSWFVGFAPADNPQIAICVLLEGGYRTVTGAHEVARKVFDAYLLE